MKSLAELAAIKDRMKQNATMREDGDNATRIVVGMATCGIAAGARGIINAVTTELAKRDLEHVTVAQTGCIGMCRLEPIMDVIVPGQEKVTYVHLTPEKVAKIISDHVVNGNVVAEYTIGAYENE
ncbi:MAG: (2Fe-2S) ferredoxin domain-containing protein [Oscillospiraceae bacterium]|nr:(2Fe-2S) ferredoxin domain-containing protein [Oscillospiraceae bacterium]